MHPPSVSWREGGVLRRARWLTADGRRPPAPVHVVGDDLSADRACRLAADGAGLLWWGDHHNARTLLDAMARRIDRAADRRRQLPPAAEFHRQRQHRARRAHLLGAVLVELGAGHLLDLPRAPDVAAACREVYGPSDTSAVLALRELIGVQSAHEWRRTGIPVPALGARIHPHHGVFAPTRTDYVDLVAQAPLPPARRAFDIGTGTGVLAALLLHRGVPTVVATDIEARAVACARENLDRMGFAERSTVLQRSLFPPGRADLVVCNPPWMPGPPASALEAGIYDRRGAMLSAFVRGLPDHLTQRGEAWLVVSDLPELLGLRDPATVPALVSAAGLVVLDRLTARPATRARPDDDPLAGLRGRETVALWRLGR
ncbi:methyltransferase [Pseudonocardia cypriaca]|uniref:Methylase of polypeptide subunit release factors n=1 Tax=Pseudonocardia cypriaca TaxID=882449 RepID=A0A543FNP3_9PSEU|nr:class I SAM-dependent methyltransferase [Pseudonocardia cypriaca]TQM35468.1 methylase of polypeptide subunit release factors [Pseudonocardia cypriaca]